MDRELYEEILNSANIVDVISSFNVHIEKRGKNYIALCPFHDDKHPSMYISPEKKVWKCFSCGEGGNVISFVSKFKKISYDEAAREVADIIGFKDPRLSQPIFKKKVDESNERLIETINDLQKYYVYALSIPEGEKARTYLSKRGISPEQIAKYGIGYSPIDGAMTIKYLQAKGHSLKSIEDIGIALARSGSTSDHNSGRLIFPLFDPNGQVVGFSARQLEKDGTSKYINSPETPLFHKSSILYNYHNVLLSSKRDGYCYVLEGFMDVMSLERAGIKNAVALMGTALTNEQVLLLKKLNCEIRVCLDGDAPGQSAMMKMLPLLKKSGINFKLVDYEGDLRDPDDLFEEEGPEALKKRMNNLVDPFDFQLSYYMHTRKLSDSSEKNKVVSSSLPFLSVMQPGIELENYLVKLSKATGYEVSAIREILSKYDKNKDDKVEISNYLEDKVYIPGTKEKPYLKKLDEAEKTILYFMLNEDSAIEFFEKQIGSFYNDIYESLANYILEYKDTHPNEKIDISCLMSDIEKDPSASNLSNALSDLAFNSQSIPCTLKTLNSCAKVIEEEKNSIREIQKTVQALNLSDKELSGKAIAEYASKIRDKWKKEKPS